MILRIFSIKQLSPHLGKVGRTADDARANVKCTCKVLLDRNWAVDIKVWSMLGELSVRLELSDERLEIMLIICKRVGKNYIRSYLGRREFWVKSKF